MMGLLDIIDLIKGVLAFPSTILEFVKLLRKTPQEKHEDLMKKVEQEAKNFEDSGRPKWD